MTRSFNGKLKCSNCGFLTTQETAFERWIRAHPDLESRSGIVRFDLDLLLHRYKCFVDAKGDRDLQFMMFIEVKTFMGEMTAAQADTLHLLNQVMRNRKRNMHASPRDQCDFAPVLAHSLMLGKKVRLWLMGGHVLIFPRDIPEDGMLWDGKAISVAQLLGLLRFELDPDNPMNKLDVRRRSGAYGKTRKLF